MKKSLLVTLGVLVAGSVPLVFQQLRLGKLRGEYRRLEADAARVGRGNTGGREVSADWIAFFKERELLEKNGVRLDFSAGGMLERIGRLNSAQLARTIRAVLASAEISDPAKRELLAAALHAIATDRPELALDIYREHAALLAKYGDAAAVRTALLTSLAGTKPLAAIAWLHDHPAEADPLSLQAVAAAVKPELALRLLGLAGPQEAPDILRAIATAADTSERGTAALGALREHIAALPDAGARAEALEVSLQALAAGMGSAPFEAAAGWIGKSNFSPQEAAAFAGGLTYASTTTNTGRWIEWLAGNVAAENLAAPVAALVGEWTRDDYRAAGTWLAETPDNPAKNTAVAAYAEAVAAYEPRVAAQWAMTLPAGPQREEALESVHNNWPANDPQGAAEFARAHGIE